MRRSLVVAAVLFGLVSPTVSYAAAGNPASYSVTVRNYQVLRWNPCATVHIRVNLAGAPAGSYTDLVGALHLLSQASGLTFRVDGPTTAIPQPGKPAGYSGITIAWALPGSGSGRSGWLSGRNAGEGGYDATGWYEGSRLVWRISDGFVVLDNYWWSRLRAGFGTGGTRGALLLHELGHAVGLNHTGDSSQIMYPTITSKAAAWGAGDLTGLTKVGRRAGCIT
jgi:hypothetical protein